MVRRSVLVYPGLSSFSSRTCRDFVLHFGLAFTTHVWYYIMAVDRISFSYVSCMTLGPVTIPFNTVRVWTFIANTSFDPRKK
jgi:hypothetical protein